MVGLKNYKKLITNKYAYTFVLYIDKIAKILQIFKLSNFRNRIEIVRVFYKAHLIILKTLKKSR